MTYEQQLLHENWKIKRKQILHRDENKCRICFNKSYADDYKKGVLASINVFRKIKGNIHQIVLSENPYDFTICYLHETFQREFLADKIFYFTEDSNEHNVVAIRSSTDSIGISNYFGREYLANLSRSMINKEATINNENSSNFELPPPFHNLIHKVPKQSDIWDYITGLHIHHRYYQKERLAWEYPNDTLITLCWKCHESLHRDTEIPVLDTLGRRVGNYTPCKRCFGAGKFPQYDYVKSGICFRCSGAKYEELMTNI